MEDKFSKMKELLDNETYPLPYLFKFVIETNPDDENKIKDHFSKTSEIKIKMSKNNKYISISILETMESSDEIIQKYVSISTTVKNVILI